MSKVSLYTIDHKINIRFLSSTAKSMVSFCSMLK
uniref:Uncharacterized protein n=1 Tax=Arundo donax TaxID=35708 RepID=A0A0A8Z136_ARUDO